MNEKPEPDTDESVSPRKPPSFLFRLVIPVTFVFVFSCFVMLTHDLLGDQNSRFAEFLRKHGTRVLAWEAVAAIAMAVVAMFADRMKALRAAAAEQPTGEVGDEGVGSTSSGVNDGQSES